jgi:hypothetical protein
MVWGETPEGTVIPLDPKAPVYSIEGKSGPTGRLPVVRCVSVMVSHVATCREASAMSNKKKSDESQMTNG